MAERQHPDQEGFGEASLGEAQATNPGKDPEMLRDEDPGGRQDPAARSEDAGESDVERFEREIDEDPSQVPDDPGLRRLQGG